MASFPTTFPINRIPNQAQCPNEDCGVVTTAPSPFTSPSYSINAEGTQATLSFPGTCSTCNKPFLVRWHINVVRAEIVSEAK